MKLTDLSLPEPEQISGEQMLCRKWSKYFAVAVVAIAILVLIGWQWGIIYLEQSFPPTTLMVPLPALGFVLAAASILSFLKRRSPGKT